MVIIVSHSQTLKSTRDEGRGFGRRIRDIASRIVAVSWLVTLIVFIYGLFHSADRDPLQFGSAILTVILFFVSLVLSIMYFVIVLFTRPGTIVSATSPTESHQSKEGRRN